MNKHASPNIHKQIWPFASSETVAEEPSNQLEVNVIFTDRDETIAALKAAKSLARDLGARIRLLAAIVVPLRLPLDQPHISVQFMEQSLQDMTNQVEPDGTETVVELYICRDWLTSLAGILRPNSLLVLGERKRWWTTPTFRLAQALRSLGHRVALVDSRRPSAGRFGNEIGSGHRESGLSSDANWIQGAKSPAQSQEP
jgi:hypothetical protein